MKSHLSFAARKCSATNETERHLERAGNFNASSLTHFECTKDANPLTRYTQKGEKGSTGVWCGYSQFARPNCSGPLVFSEFDIYHPTGQGRGVCVPQPGFVGMNVCILLMFRLPFLVCTCVFVTCMFVTSSRLVCYFSKARGRGSCLCLLRLSF